MKIKLLQLEQIIKINIKVNSQYIKVDLEDMKFKNVNLDSNLINCKVWNVRYT